MSRLISFIIFMISNGNNHSSIVVFSVHNPKLGTNTQVFDESSADDFEMELARATPEEKEKCLIRVTDRQTLTPKQTAEALKQLQEVARLGGNVFEELMKTVKVASLGQITDALFNVGGQYRRNM
jgi:methylmalonyl-CoA mutase